MRSLFVLAFALSAAGCAGEAERAGEPRLSTDLVSPRGDARPAIRFADTAHAFGTIREGEVAEYSFSFTNPGSAPLVISGADASCGCTVPDYPRDPIAPGASGDIKVKFNSAGKPGHQEKSVTLLTNAGAATLHISAEVQPASGDQ